MKRNPFIFLTPLFFLALAIGAWKFVLHPQIVNWVHAQIPKWNSSQKFVEFEFDELHISLLKLQLSASNVEVRFKNDLIAFESFKVHEVKIQVSPFDLLVGQLNINSITFYEMNWNFSDKAFLSNTKSSHEDLPIDAFFKYLPQIPLSRIKLIDSSVQIAMPSKKLKLLTHLDNANLENSNYRVNLDVTKGFESIQYEASTPVRFDLGLSASLTKDRLSINSFVVKGIESEVRIKAQFTQLKSLLSHPTGDISLDSTILCDNVRTLYLSLLTQKSRMPSVSGQIQTSARISVAGITKLNGQIEINTTNLNVDHFNFGKAQIKAQIKNNQLAIEKVNLEHPAGAADLTEIEIEQAKPYLFKTKLNVKSFDLQKLFVSLGLSNIPADLNLNGHTECKGQLTAPFNIECAVDAAVSNIVIKSTMNDPSSILKIKQGHVQGSLLVNNEDIQFDTQVTLGSSTGTAKGIVDLTKGFKIDFKSEQLNTKDIESIAGLDLDGIMKIEGTTEGDSNQGIVETDLSIKNASIEKFILGNIATELKYEKGNLFFRKIDGQVGQSKYAGDISFDFNKAGSLAGNIKSSQLQGEDVDLALSEKFDLPFEISGSGAADIAFSGPISFWKMKYELKSFLQQGSIADEGFDRLDLNLSSDGQKIDFKQVALSKAKSKVNIAGFIDTKEKKPEFKLYLKTNQSYLEEVDAINRLLPTLTGLIAVNGIITGSIDSPEIKMDFNARQLNLDGFDYPPSQGNIEINKKYFILNGQLLGRQLQASLKWPWSDKDDYAIKLQVRDLNPLILLPLISLPQPNMEFYSRINLDMDLKADTKSLQKTRGQINLTDLLLQRGGQSVKLKAASSIIFENGLKKMDPIDLLGPENKLSISLLESTKSEAKLNVTADLKVRLLQFLVPFVDAINGQLTADAQIILRAGPLQIFGAGQLSEGSLQLKGFPSTLENVATPIEFSQSKIFFSDLTARLGNSEIDGSGQIEIKGPKNIVVQLQAEAENLELTFPEKVTTSGKADINFFGSWLPYTLKINYRVSHGLVEKDFGADSSSAVSVKASHFLPPKQIESQSPSLLLDVSVDISQGVTIKNKLLEGTATGNLNIKGNPENPIVLGDIEIKSGSKIIFKDKPFEVQTAKIHFTPTTEINPDIYISANARVSDYDINLLVQGPAKSPLIEASSQPPLSKTDIFSLLALGMTSTKMDQNLSSEAQQRQTGIEVIAALSNQSDFNKKLQQKLGLNVQLAPSVDSTKSIAVPKVVVSKQILKKLNASYSKPLTGEQNQEVKLQYLFNPHWSGILNYQNKETNQQDGTTQTLNPNETGILGGEFEYKKEFKW